MTNKYSAAVDEPKREPVPVSDPKPNEEKPATDKPNPDKVVAR